jgi:TonB family protein
MKSLMSGPGGLDEAAITTIKKWKFQPGKSGGKPIDTSVIIPIEFSLTN